MAEPIRNLFDGKFHIDQHTCMGVPEKIQTFGFSQTFPCIVIDQYGIYVKDENQKLQVFERGSVYLATKKIGKNNPKAQEIEADNQKRREWNRAVDMALISGVPELKIMEVKRKEITEPIRKSIARRGNRPRLFSRVVTVAVEALEFLIASVLFKKPREVPEQTKTVQAGRTEAEHQEHIAENSMAAVKAIKDEKSESEQPKMTRLASKYSKLFKVNKELEEQNSAIQKKQKQLSAKKPANKSQVLLSRFF